MKELKIKFKSEFDYKSVQSGVEQISKALGNINIEDKVKSKLEAYIKNIGDKIDNLSRIDIDKEGVGTYKSALKDISREYDKLRNAAKGIDLKDVSFPKETTEQIKNITSELEKLKAEREKIIESFQNTYAPTQKRFAASLFDTTSKERTQLKNDLVKSKNEHIDSKFEIGKNQIKKQQEIETKTKQYNNINDKRTKQAKQLKKEIEAAQKEIEEYKVSLKNINSQIKQLDTQISIIDSFESTNQEIKITPNTQKIEEATKELKGLNKSAKDAAKQGLDDFNDAIEKGNDSTSDAIYNENKLLDANQELNRSYDNMKKRVANILSFAAAFRIIGRVVRETINTVSDFDKTFTNIAMVAGKTRDEMWGMFDTFNSMANKLGVTTKSVMESSKLFYQQGLDTNEVLLRTEATVKLATISGMDFTTATNQMTAALNGFNLSGKEANTVSDIFANLAAKAAVDVSELSEALTKTASIAKSAGMSIDTTSAFLTKMIETTREAPENIGTAMKTIVARMQELKNSPTTLLEDGVDANKVEKALKEADVALRDSTGQFRNLDDVLLDLGSKWEGLDRNTQRYIATIIAGSRQQSRLLALLDDNARTVELVEIAQNSQGAATIQQATNLDSVEASLNRLTATWEKFKTGLLESNWVKGFYDFANGALKLFDQLGVGITVFIPLATLLGVKLSKLVNKVRDLKAEDGNTSGLKKLANIIKERVKAWFTEEQAIQRVIDKKEELNNTPLSTDPTNGTPAAGSTDIGQTTPKTESTSTKKTSTSTKKSTSKKKKATSEIESTDTKETTETTNKKPASKKKTTDKKSTTKKKTTTTPKVESTNTEETTTPKVESNNTKKTSTSTKKSTSKKKASGKKSISKKSTAEIPKVESTDTKPTAETPKVESTDTKSTSVSGKAIAKFAIGAAGTLISTVGRSIINANNIFATTSKRKEEKEEAYQEASAKSSQKIQENTELKKLIKNYETLNDKTVKTAEEMEQMQEIAAQIKEIDSKLVDETTQGLKLISDNVDATIKQREDEQLALQQQAIMADPIANNAELQNLEDQALQEAEKQTEALSVTSDILGGIGSTVSTLGMSLPGTAGIIVSSLGAILSVVSLITELVGANKAKKEYEQQLLDNKEKYAKQYGETAKEYTAAELEKSMYADIDDASKKAISNIVGNKVKDEVNSLTSGEAIQKYGEGLETTTSHISSAIVVSYNELGTKEKEAVKVLANANKYTQEELKTALGDLQGSTNTYILGLKDLYSETFKKEREESENQIKNLFGTSDVSDIVSEMTGDQLNNLVSSLGKLSNETAQSFGTIITELYSQLESGQAELLNKISNMDFSSLSDIIGLALMGNEGQYNSIIATWAKGTKFTYSGVKQTELDLEANFKVKEEEFDKIKKALSEGITTEDKQKIVENYDLSEEMFKLIDGQWVLAEEYQGRAMKNFEATALYTARAERDALNVAYKALQSTEKGVITEQQKIIQKQIDSYNSYINNLEKQIAKQAVEAVKKEANAKLDARKDYLSKLKKLYDEEKKLREKNQSREDLAEKEARLAFLMQDQTGANAEEITSLQKEIEGDRENLQDEAIQEYFDSIQKSIEEESGYLDNIDENSAEVKKLLDSWQGEATKNESVLEAEAALEYAISTSGGDIKKAIEKYAEVATKERKEAKIKETIDKTRSNLENAYISGNQKAIDNANKQYTDALSVATDNQMTPEASFIDRLNAVKQSDSDIGTADYEKRLEQTAHSLGVFNNYSGQQISEFINGGQSSKANAADAEPKPTGLFASPKTHSLTPRDWRREKEPKGIGKYIYDDKGVIDAEVSLIDDENFNTNYKDKLNANYSNGQLIYDSNHNNLYIRQNETWYRLLFNNDDKRKKYQKYATQRIGRQGESLTPYSKGGYVTETGPVMVHGTPNKPEAFLSAEDTAMMREFLNTMGQNRNFNFRNNNIPQKVENHTSVQNILNLKIEKVETEADIDEVMRQVESKFNEMSDRISVPYIR